MKQMIALAGLFAVAILYGCQDRYRYECQDPANYNTLSCNPPACEASGTCTKYLIGEPSEK